MKSFFELANEAKIQLGEYYSDTAKFEVDYLMSHCFNLSKADIVAKYHEVPESVENVKAFQECLDRRKAGEPIDLIIGTAIFCGHEYKVEKGVLIPRSETELLVTVAKETIPQYTDSNFTCLEVGFGTGIISIELALSFKKAKFVAYDICKNAHSLAVQNAKALEVTNVEWKHGDFFQDERHDSPTIIISNPPYIPSGDIEKLDKSVRNYDPVTALDGGKDGLDYYQKLAESSADKPCLMIIEIGIDQLDSITKIYEDKQFVIKRCEKDMQMIPRVIVATNLA